MRIKTNSKYVKRKDIFVCLHDEMEDRHKYIKDIKRASAIVIDKEINEKTKIPLIRVENTQDSLYEIYNNYYGNPLEGLNLIGVTGTDGKTTTALIIKQLLNDVYKTAYLGTNGFVFDDKTIKMVNTTPQIDIILKCARVLSDENVKNLVMEVSSEGLFHNRCQNLIFKRAIITNVTEDHLNIHKTFENYLNSKLKLFDQLDYDKVAIVNIDDVSYKYLKGKNLNLITYGENKGANFKIENIRLREDGTIYTLKVGSKRYEIVSPLLGRFNAYNLTAAIACLNSLGIEMNDIIRNIGSLKDISGRMNILMTKRKAKIILDYAHTENAIWEILSYANKIKKGKIITVTGAAGGREKEKRGNIGRIVTDLSDEVIFTMDDPRYEKVDAIIDDLTRDVTKNNFISIKNRNKAIKYAINKAEADDLILILGKGTDNYMAVRNKRKKYSDLDVIRKYI